MNCEIIIYIKKKMGCFMNDDREYIEAIREASLWATGSYLRSFFVMLLLSSTITCPKELWDATWEILSQDIQHRQRELLNLPGIFYR